METGNPYTLNTQFIGGYQLYRPSARMERQVGIEAERHLRKGYSAGVYTSPEKINEILKYRFSFFEDILGDRIPCLASWEFMDFILSQYDVATKIEHAFKAGKLSKAESKNWRELAPITRRSMKHLAETVTRLANDKSPTVSDSSIPCLTDIVWICAEQVTILSQLSDQTIFIMPNRTVLEISPEGRELYIQLRLPGYDDSLFKRITQSRDNEDLFFQKPTFEIDLDQHYKYLNEAFADKFGTSCEILFHVLGSLIDNMSASGNSLDVPFQEKGLLIRQFADNASITQEASESFLSGFIVTKKAMDLEGRLLWKPNQEHRAYYRGFFEISHETGPIIIWSREMARECCISLLSDLVYQRVAPEWNTSTINEALGALSNAHGRWFEEVTANNFGEIGFVGVKSRNNLGTGDRQISVPSEVGEIDYLGYAPRESLLIVAECKAASTGTDARFFRNELSKFVTDPNSYIKRFRKKIYWVVDNAQAVCRALESEPEIKNQVPRIEPSHIASVMITRHPSIASDFIDDIPCASLAELRMAYGCKGHWPYDRDKVKL